jgi:transcription initiation factor IIF auxiliary subunit
MMRTSKFMAKAQVVQDESGRIKFLQRSETSREVYNVSIWIEGAEADLDQIDRIDYLLHPTFQRQIRTSKNRSIKFGITIWTWGVFNIHITIHVKDGSTSEMDYFLNYDLPPDDGSNYV